MREFLIIFKHELKMLFPMFNFKKNAKKPDVFGAILSWALTILLAVGVIILISRIANGYILVKVDKILNPIARSVELLNILYCFITVIMIISCTRKMCSVLTAKENKEIYLRLPIKQNILFLSKLASLMIWTYIFATTLVLPVNIIFFMVLKPSVLFWFKTLLVLLLLPIIVFGISTLLIVPYLKIVEFLKYKYLLLFLTLSGLLIGAFVLYAKFLNIVQLWLETGSIKFLFNKEFISSLQTWLKWSYPTNCFAQIMVGSKFVVPFVIVLLLSSLGVFISYKVSNKLFNLTLYKQDSQKQISKPKILYTKTNQLTALIKKEFICVYRNPKNLFSCIIIATAMPVMVYCCYTLFESLIVNAFGLTISFSLALMIMLIFSVLTNTFCATNISRDGLSFIKVKSLAVKPTITILAKVIFCGVISSLSILVSSGILIAFTNLKIFEGIIITLLVLTFSFAQIVVATKLDLNHTKFSSTQAETEIINGKTVTKVVFIGLILALFMGISSVIIHIFSQTLKVNAVFAYIIPILIALIYLAIAIVYYIHKINESFNKLNS